MKDYQTDADRLLDLAAVIKSDRPDGSKQLEEIALRMTLDSIQAISDLDDMLTILLKIQKRARA